MTFGGVVQGGRDGVLFIDHVVMAQAIELVGGDAGLNMWGDEIEYFRAKSTGDAHFFDVGRGLDGDGRSHGILGLVAYKRPDMLT